MPGQPAVPSAISGWGKRLFSPPTVQSDFGVHPALYAVSNGLFFPGGKAAES